MLSPESGCSPVKSSTLAKATAKVRSSLTGRTLVRDAIVLKPIADQLGHAAADSVIVAPVVLRDEVGHAHPQLHMLPLVLLPILWLGADESPPTFKLLGDRGEHAVPVRSSVHVVEPLLKHERPAKPGGRNMDDHELPYAMLPCEFEDGNPAMPACAYDPRTLIQA